MNDGYGWWLILVGAVIALVVVAVYAARLPRQESDVSPEERRAEAAWISETIERFGGVAPPELVEEVLELHAGYLASPRLARIPEARAGTDAGAPRWAVTQQTSGFGAPARAPLGAGQPPAGQPAPGQPPAGQPAPGQPAPGQPAPGQPAPALAPGLPPQAPPPVAPSPVRPRGELSGAGRRTPPPASR